MQWWPFCSLRLGFVLMLVLWLDLGLTFRLTIRQMKPSDYWPVVSSLVSMLVDVTLSAVGASVTLSSTAVPSWQQWCDIIARPQSIRHDRHPARDAYFLLLAAHHLLAYLLQWNTIYFFISVNSDAASHHSDMSPVTAYALILYMTLLPYLKMISDPLVYGVRMCRRPPAPPPATSRVALDAGSTALALRGGPVTAAAVWSPMTSRCCAMTSRSCCCCPPCVRLLDRRSVYNPNTPVTEAKLSLGVEQRQQKKQEE